MEKRITFDFKKNITDAIKIILFQLFIINLIFVTTVVAGQGLENVKINLNANNSKLEKIFEKIEGQTEYKFFYIKNDIPLNSKMTINAKNAPLSTVLDKIAKKNNLSFKLIKHQIVIRKNEQEKKGKGKIKGVVIDAKNNDPLIGANVFILETAYGAATNIDGEYSISNIPAGNYTLRVSYLGYEKKDVPVKISPGKTLNLNIELQYSGSIDLEEVEVTAQVKGQISAINEQLSSHEIKNVVSKDRIQELPDANAAESVGRLSGVSILRDGGEGNKVVIRGLSPKYNKVMIDGIDLASTDEGDRSTDISMISPYSLEGIEVIKAATADRDADYVGGAVNFKIKKADKGLKTNIIAFDTYNNLRSDFSNYTFVGSVEDRFFNDKLGVFLQANIEQKDRGSNQLGADYYLVTHDINKVNPTKLENLFLTNAFRTRKRYGGTLTLDYNIPNGNIFLKNFLSVGNTEINLYREKYDVRKRGHNYLTNTRKNNLQVMSNILNYEQKFGDVKFTASLSHAFSQNEIPEDINFDFVEPLPALPQGVTDLPPDSIPYLAYNNYDRAYWSNVKDNKSLTKERQFSAKANLEMNLDLTKQITGTLKFGAKYRMKKRSHNLDATGGTMALNSGIVVKNAILNAFPWMQDTAPIGTAQLPYTLFINKNFDHGEFLKGDYALGPVVDINLMREVIKVMRGVKSPAIDTYSKLNMTSITNDYNGNEYLSAGYVMANLDMYSIIKFIPGVRYEHYVTEYNGIRGFSNSGFPEQNYPHKDTTTQRVNDYLLPMMQLQIKPVDWLQIRMAYTQTLSRPNFNFIVPRVDVGQDDIIYNNYKLKPERSENIDIYFAVLENHIGLFTLGVFQKKIKDMIFWLDKRVLLNPAEYNFSDKEKGKFLITQQNIKKTATVQGIELDWQTNFWYLPSFLKGLVFNVNYTYIFSEAKYPRTVIETKYNYTEPPYGLIQKNKDTTYTQRLIDQPDNILHMSLGYDYKGFSFRVSMLYQANIFKNPNFYPELRASSDDYLRWDVSLKQKLPVKGLQLFLNANNITASTDVVLNDARNLPTSIEHYGMTMDIGLRWNLN